MELFGFQITRKPSVTIPPQIPVTAQLDGSAIMQSTSSLGGFYTYAFDLDGTIKNEIECINRYREISSYPECDKAVEQVVNEAVITEEEELPVTIDVSKLDKKYRGVGKKIEDEFQEILKLLKFNRNCHDIFKRWYIDGHLYYYAAVDAKSPRKGIQELVYIDPRKIKKVVNVEKEKKNNVDVIKKTETFYIFNDEGLANATQGVKLSPLTVVDVKSGLIDANSGMSISYLHKAIKPVNQLKMMEDALVIYRITRAPERKIFYVDVGNMQPQRAEQYVQQMMNKFRNKIQYDAQTGEVKQNRNFISMMEDYWLPRREGNRATEISSLEGGRNLSEIEDIVYFQKKLYQSLNVPLQRLQPEQNFSLGRTQEITREEITFAKLVEKLRNNFSDLFREALKIQLIAKNIIKPDEFDEIFTDVYFKYQHDNYFEELKKVEVFTERMNLMMNVDNFVGKYFSKEYVVKKILRLDDAEWKEIKKQMEKEREEDKENGTGEFEDFGNDNADNGDEDNQNQAPQPPKPPQPKDDSDESDESDSNEDDDSDEDEDKDNK